MLSYDTPGLSDTEDNNTGKHAANYCRIRKLHNWNLRNLHTAHTSDCGLKITTGDGNSPKSTAARITMARHVDQHPDNGEIEELICKMNVFFLKKVQGV